MNHKFKPHLFIQNKYGKVVPVEIEAWADLEVVDEEGNYHEVGGYGSEGPYIISVEEGLKKYKLLEK